MQTLKIISAILAVVIGTSAFFPYIRDIFLKKTKPHSYTWLIWSITQGVAVAGLWHGKGGLGAIELTVGTVLVFLVFLFSLKHGTKNITMSDTIILIVALFAIFIWWQLDNPVLAILIITAVDVIGFIPSYRKSWADPWSETLLSWKLFSIGNIFAILALSNYNLLTLTYLCAITACNIIILIICVVRRRKIKLK